MKTYLCVLLALFGYIIAVPISARGDIILTIDVGSFASDSSIGTLDIYARSNNADQLIALTIDFELSGGVFLDPPGTYGAPGMIGAGNLNPASFFFRNNNKSASLSFDFNSVHRFLADDTVLATLQLDLTGLSEGFYPVKIIDSTADAGRVHVSMSDFGQPGGIYIQAIPEPSSFVLCAALAPLILSRRRNLSRTTRSTVMRHGE